MLREMSRSVLYMSGIFINGTLIPADKLRAAKMLVVYGNFQISFLLISRQDVDFLFQPGLHNAAGLMECCLTRTRYSFVGRT